MPIVTVQMFSGRDNTTKELIVRAVADTISEHIGVTRDGVEVIFQEIDRGNWALGPRLAANRVDYTPKKDPGALVTISRISIQPGKHPEYLDWRRNSVYPYMASHEGFVSSTVLDVPDQPDEYVLINKWRDEASYDAYLANPRESELRAEAKQFVSELAVEILRGSVVAVF